MIESYNDGMALAMEDTHILKEYGFILPRRQNAESPEGAVKIAERFGYPVVLKVVSKNILHKTNVGGVRLNLHSPDDIHRAFVQIMESVKCFMPEADIDALAVEEMCPAGIELFLGLENNAQFGPTITFGLGGIFIEIVNDVTTRVLPITPADAAEMIGELFFCTHYLSGKLMVTLSPLSFVFILTLSSMLSWRIPNAKGDLPFSSSIWVISRTVPMIFSPISGPGEGSSDSRYFAVTLISPPGERVMLTSLALLLTACNAARASHLSAASSLSSSPFISDISFNGSLVA